VSLKALPVNALIGLEQTTRFTGGHDLCLFNLFYCASRKKYRNHGNII